MLPHAGIELRLQRLLQVIPGRRAREEDLRRAEHQPVVIDVQHPAGQAAGLDGFHRQPVRPEDIQPAHHDPVARLAILPRVGRLQLDIRQTGDREDFAGLIGLQQIGHHHVRGHRHVGGRQLQLVDEFPRLGLYGETEQEKLLETLLQGLGVRVVDRIRPDGAVLRAKGNGDARLGGRFARVQAGQGRSHRLRMQILHARQRPHLRQRQAGVARQTQRLALPQHLDHAIQIGAWIHLAHAHGAGFPVGSRRVILQRQRRLYGRLHREGPANPGDLVVDLGTVHQRHQLRRLVVGDGLQRDARHKPADLLALAVLLALVAKAAGRSPRRVLQPIPGKGRRDQPLPGQRQRHPRGIAGDPAPAPLLGDVCRGPRSAGDVHHQITGIGGHLNTSCYNTSRSLYYILLIF